VAPEDRGAGRDAGKKLTGKGSAPYTLRLVSKEGKRHKVEVSSRWLLKRRATGVQGNRAGLDGETRLEAELTASAKDGKR